MIGFLESVFSSAFLWVILSAMLAGGLLYWSYKYTVAKISQGERYAQVKQRVLQWVADCSVADSH